MNRPIIAPPKGYKFQVPSPSKQRKPHVPNVMPEQGRKPRVMSHHSEAQRLPVASASKKTPESPRSPMLPVSTVNTSSPGSAGVQHSRPNTAQQRLANAHASRAVKQNRSRTKPAALTKDHQMSIADRLRAVNDSRPDGQNASDTKDTIDGPLPPLTKQAKKEIQPSFDSAYNSVYSAYTSCTEYTEPSMGSDTTPFDPNAPRKRDIGVENELLQHTSSKLATDSTDEFDAKACLIATKELTELLADDVKEIAGFATFAGEKKNSDSMSVDTPEEKTETKTESEDKLAVVSKKETDPTMACLAETQDCMMSFHEDVTFVAGLGFSKIQEACLPEGPEDSPSIQEETKDKSAKEADASLGAKKISNKTSTSTVEGASGQKASGASKDDDSGLFGATADCFAQLKDDIRFGVTQIRDLKLSELEMRGLIVSITQGLDEPVFLTEGDTGSVLTDDFRSSTASVNDLDSLADSQSPSTADSAPSIDAMSADPVPCESVVDSIKKQLELETIRSFGDPVIEEIKRTDPPGEEEDDDDYAIAASKSSTGRADPPACDKPFEDLPSIAPGNARDGDGEDIEETDELVTVEETIDEESVEEEVEEEVIDEQNESVISQDEVIEEVEEENATVETEMETDTDVDQSDTSTTQENLLQTLEEADDVNFPNLLPDEI